MQNEPVYAFEPGSKIRQDVQDSLASIQSTTKDIPIVIGGEEIYDGDVRYQVSVSALWILSFFFIRAINLLNF